jgi:hypothetical protein
MITALTRTVSSNSTTQRDVTCGRRLTDQQALDDAPSFKCASVFWPWRRSGGVAGSRGDPVTAVNGG